MLGAPPVIAINSSYTKPVACRRFTLAHEIRHHLLTGKINPDSRLFFFDTARVRRTIIESACDRFAALLLMPEDLIRLHHTELTHNAEQRVRIMAERFGVSAWAMRRRLRELKLPYAMRRR